MLRVYDLTSPSLATSSKWSICKILHSFYHSIWHTKNTSHHVRKVATRDVVGAVSVWLTHLHCAVASVAVCTSYRHRQVQYLNMKAGIVE